MLLKGTEQLDDLKSFILDWFGKYDKTNGVPEAEIPPNLPRALRELYKFAGRWKDGSDGHQENSPEIFQHQDCLYSIEQLIFDGDRITFLEENQGNWTCQVESRNDDSPVYCDEYLLRGDYTEEHVIVSRSLYHFLKSFCLQEIVFGCKHLYAIDEATDNIKRLFGASIEEIWIGGHYIAGEPTHSFYRCGDALMMEYFGDYWLGYNCDSPMALNKKVLSSMKHRKIN